MWLTAKELFDLFVHRRDVFAIQLDDGRYVPERRPITINDIEKHLDGKITIGVYCLNTDNTIKWACVDLDGSNLPRMSEEADIMMGIFPEFRRIKEFSGRRGWHVWVLFDKPMQAAYAQKLVKARLNRVNMLKYEVFPKQISLDKNRKYGNLCKLPLGIHRKSGKRSEITKYEH